MNNNEFSEIFNYLKDKLNEMDVYQYFSYLKKLEKDILPKIYNDESLEKESLENNSLLDVLITDLSFKNKIADRIIEESATKDTWKYFRDLLSIPNGIDNMLKIFTEDNLDKASVNSKVYMTLFEAMTENNPKKVLEFALENDYFFDRFKSISHRLNSLLTDLDYSLIRKLIDKDIDFVSTSISFTDKNYKELIEDSTINNNILYSIISNIKNIQLASDFFINDPRRNEIFDKLSPRKTKELLDRKVSFSYDILNSNKIFESLKSNSIVELRNNINIFEENNPSIEIEDKLRTCYEKIISTYNKETGMFNDYEKILEIRKNNGFINTNEIDKNSILFDKNMYKCKTLEDFRELSLKILKDITMDFIFKDNKYNVELNMKELHNYNKENTPINVEREYKLKEIIELINYSNSENTIHIFNRLKYGNIHELYYDAIRETKENVNSKIKESIETTNKGNPVEIDDVNVYDLRNKPFYMLVRVIGSPFREETSNESDCYSLISNENTTMISENNDCFIYGYENFDPKRILHIFEGDAYSGRIGNQTTKFVNRLMTPKDIVTKDSSFSEIQYKNEKVSEYQYKSLKPSYIVALNNINERSIKDSKRLNIPIILIKTKSLENTHINSLNNLDDQYVYDQYDEKARNR